MSKKNLPNIPLYIGDWEKDCNVLSLRAEAAWLRIIFKMFTNGKQSTYKLPTNGLQNLWKVSITEVNEILQELIDFDICEINTYGRFTEFTCRRFKKENDISEVRKGAVSSRKDRKKPLQKTYKEDTNDIQITDIDYETVIEDETVIEGKGGVGEKPKDPEPKKESSIPSYEDFELYAKEKEPSVNLPALKNKYDAWKENDWKDGNNQRITNWKSKLLNTMPYLPKNTDNGKSNTGNKTAYKFDLNRAISSATGGTK